MRNADMPAMAVVGSDCHGLTKREYFMANAKLADDAMKFNDQQTFEDFIGRSIDMQSVEDVAMAQCEAMAKLKRMQIDADLAELEKTQ